MSDLPNEPLKWELNPDGAQSSVRFLTVSLPTIAHDKSSENAIRGAARRLIATALEMIDAADEMKERK